MLCVPWLLALAPSVYCYIEFCLCAPYVLKVIEEGELDGERPHNKASYAARLVSEYHMPSAPIILEHCVPRLVLPWDVVVNHLGVLLRAKRAGTLSSVTEAMHALRAEAGFFIAEPLYQQILQAAGEN